MTREEMTALILTLSGEEGCYRKYILGEMEKQDLANKEDLVKSIFPSVYEYVLQNILKDFTDDELVRLSSRLGQNEAVLLARARLATASVGPQVVRIVRDKITEELSKKEAEDADAIHQQESNTSVQAVV